MSEAGEKFEQAQQCLVDKFKEKMRKASDEILGELYCDVSNFAESDAHTNYRNYLRDKFKESFIKEITEDYEHYSWAHDIRMRILKEYPEQLSNKINEDLRGRITQLEENLEELRRRFRY